MRDWAARVDESRSKQKIARDGLEPAASAAFGKNRSKPYGIKIILKTKQGEAARLPLVSELDSTIRR